MNITLKHWLGQIVFVISLSTNFTTPYSLHCVGDGCHGGWWLPW